MRKYRFVPHTADVRFYSYGSTFEQLLENSLMAMFDLTADVKKINRDIENSTNRAYTLTIKERAKNEKDLLWYIMQRVLSELDAIGAYGYGVKKLNLKYSRSAISAEAKILYAHSKEEYAKIYIKGVSGYTLEVKRIRNLYRASVVIDI